MYKKTIILSEQAVISLSNFVLTIIAARILSLEEFGIFAFLLAMILLINSIHQATITLPMMSLPSNENCSKAYRLSLHKAQFLFLLFSIVAYFLIFKTASLIIDLPKNALLPSMLIVIFYHTQDYLRRLHFIDNEEWLALISSMTSYGLRFLIIYFFFIYFNGQLTIEHFLWSISISFALGLAISVKVLAKHGFGFNLKFSEFEKHWNTSKWLLPSSLLQWSSINLFFIAAAAVISPIALAAMRMGQNLTQIISIVLMAGENYFPKQAANIYKSEGPEKLLKYLIKIALLVISVFVVFSTLVYFNTETIINNIYGNKFIEYDFVIIYFIIFSFQMILMSIIRIFFRVLSLTKPWFIGYLSATVFSALTVYPLETNYGLEGALTGLILSQFVLLTSSVYFYKKRH